MLLSEETIIFFLDKDFWFIIITLIFYEVKIANLRKTNLRKDYLMIFIIIKKVFNIFLPHEECLFRKIQLKYEYFLIVEMIS